MLTTTLDGKKRFFGACVKAVRTYRLLNKGVVLSGVSALCEWADEYVERPAVTDRTRTDADVKERRLKDLRSFVASRQEFSDLNASELRQIDQLLLDLAKITAKPRMVSRKERPHAATITVFGEWRGSRPLADLFRNI